MKKRFREDAEFREYRFLYENCPELDEYMKKRIEVSLRYFLGKANLYKRWGTAMSVLNMALPAVATFLSVFPVKADECDPLKYAVPFVAMVTTIIASLIAYFKYGEKKNAYRNSAEALKSELVLYESRTGRYKGDDAKEAFVQAVEKIIAGSYKKIVELEKNGK